MVIFWGFVPCTCDSIRRQKPRTTLNNITSVACRFVKKKPDEAQALSIAAYVKNSQDAENLVPTAGVPAHRRSV